jgi:uncharacterized protein YjbJ (UPF0337 family)
MNWDQIEGNWLQFKGQIKERWGKLTDSDFDIIRGKRDQFLGKLQERYGITKEEAHRQLEEFQSTFKPPKVGQRSSLGQMDKGSSKPSS